MHARKYLLIVSIYALIMAYYFTMYYLRVRGEARMLHLHLVLTSVHNKREQKERVREDEREEYLNN